MERTCRSGACKAEHFRIYRTCGALDSLAPGISDGARRGAGCRRAEERFASRLGPERRLGRCCLRTGRTLRRRVSGLSVCLMRMQPRRATLPHD